MEGTQEDDMYLFDTNFNQAPTPMSGQIFDEFLLSSPTKAANAASPTYMDPNELTVKPATANAPPGTFDPRTHAMEISASPSGSSSSSSRGSSDSPEYRERHMSLNSADSTQLKGKANLGQWTNGFNGLMMPTDEDFFTDADMSGLNGNGDFEVSNQQMESAFDFDTATAASSAFRITSTPSSKPINLAGSRTSGHNKAVRSKNAGPVQFFFGESRETSPMNAMLPVQGQSPWTKHSPSSGLEETFNGINMHGDSPGNATFSPNLHFSGHPFSMDGDSTTTPSTFTTKDISSPPSTAPSLDGHPTLTVYPTSLKSRVETQIPIKMTLHPLPPGITKLKLPTHTVSKPKFLAKPPPERSADTLELHTSLVCTSAMQDPKKLEKAFTRARGEDIGFNSKASPDSQSSKDDEDKPLNGAEVKICSGCIQRERKRASRKKQKKPEEEQMFQRDEEKRVVVFNTNEIKEWVDPSKEAQKGTAGGPLDAQESLIPGVMQVELPMRIACYCRHHNEKLGFQVIFTIKDYTDKVIAQAITNPIMITDDHKTHNLPPTAIQTPTGVSPNGAPQVPGSGVFASSGGDNQALAQDNKIFKQSLSTTDLQGLQQNFNPKFPLAPSSTPFAVPSTNSVNTSGTMTPRNLSRPPSPGAVSGPTSKRRKQSSGKVPSMLAMTRLETSNSASNSSSNSQAMTNGTLPSPFHPNAPPLTLHTDRGFVMPNNRPGQYGTSPPTPNSNDNGFIAPASRSFSMELPRQGLISAPNSRQPSRPGSPVSTRNSFGAPETQMSQPQTTIPHQLFPPQGRRPAPLIHKLVPAEGSILGGTEVTLLGNGFYQGLEVMFGDTEATTTTFWGEKCLNCLTPPAIQPGTVAVIFKHEHPQFSQMPAQAQSRPSLFTYVDDREVEMYRLALKTLGKRLQNPTDDPYAAAQQLLGNSGQSLWGMQNNFGSSSGQQRQANPLASAFGDVTELETNMLAFLEYLDEQSAGMPVLDLQRPTGHTLLHLASSLGMSRFVSGLLSRGANPNVLDNNGNTPMHLAAMFGHSHIVHRLRLAGGDHKIRSIRNFVPADLATSLLAHQASVLPNHHYRSRSVGGTPMKLRSRNNSVSSLRSFWESASISNYYSDSSDESEEEDSRDNFAEMSVTSSPKASRRRPSAPNDPQRVASMYSLSRQVSAQQPIPAPPLAATTSTNEGSPVISPAAFMMAWRDQLATQIQQYQQSVNWTLPNLPTMPSLPNLPDYQDHPMVRRVSSLFPHRTNSRPSTASTGREGWWESWTGSNPSSPPAYDELYPHQENEADYPTKKASAVLAAGEAALDRHYEALEIKTASSSLVQASTSISAQSSTIQLHPATIRRREIKQIRSDRKLFFIWIPILVLLLGLMLRNIIPGAWNALRDGQKYLNDLVGNQAVAVA